MQGAFQFISVVFSGMRSGHSAGHSSYCDPTLACLHGPQFMHRAQTCRNKFEPTDNASRTDCVFRETIDMIQEHSVSIHIASLGVRKVLLTSIGSGKNIFGNFYAEEFDFINHSTNMSET